MAGGWGLTGNTLVVPSKEFAVGLQGGVQLILSEDYCLAIII